MARARAVSHRGRGEVKPRRGCTRRNTDAVALYSSLRRLRRNHEGREGAKDAKAVPLRRVAPRFARFGRAKYHERK
jgi:hypothetical protein